MDMDKDKLKINTIAIVTLIFVGFVMIYSMHYLTKDVFAYAWVSWLLGVISFFVLMFFISSMRMSYG
jgi:hypothetical protein